MITLLRQEYVLILLHYCNSTIAFLIFLIGMNFQNAVVIPQFNSKRENREAAQLNLIDDICTY